MPERFYIKQNDTLPVLRATLKDANGNVVKPDRRYRDILHACAPSRYGKGERHIRYHQ